MKLVKNIKETQLLSASGEPLFSGPNRKPVTTSTVAFLFELLRDPLFFRGLKALAAARLVTAVASEIRASAGADYISLSDDAHARLLHVVTESVNVRADLVAGLLPFMECVVDASTYVEPEAVAAE